MPKPEVSPNSYFGILMPISRDVSPEVAAVMTEEISRQHKCKPCCSQGGIPPEQADQIPGEKRRTVMQTKFSDGKLFEHVETDLTS